MGTEKILIVDDEPDILELVRYNLSREGYEIVCAESGEKALEYAQSKMLDLIILDLMLPGQDGLEVAKQLKSSSKSMHVPIIMLTAKGEEADIVTGLELGADDYVTKPFSPRVLLARIKAILRRQNNQATDEDDTIKSEEVTIHPGRLAVWVAEQVSDLTFTEFQVLSCLARRPGWVLTRSQIVDAVRGNDYAVTDRSVDVQIVGIRKKLGPFGKYIQTVRGVGYRFQEK